MGTYRWSGVRHDALPYVFSPEYCQKIDLPVDRHFTGRSCTPFIAPFDVVFDETNVVQPDVFVVCDQNKITNANISGAPDLIFEILSPSSKLHPDTI
jgi:hypothetical protein